MARVLQVEVLKPVAMAALRIVMQGKKYGLTLKSQGMKGGSDVCTLNRDQNSPLKSSNKE